MSDPQEVFIEAQNRMLDELSHMILGYPYDPEMKASIVLHIAAIMAASHGMSHEDWMFKAEYFYTGCRLNRPTRDEVH
jgi:hypothetical protein